MLDCLCPSDQSKDKVLVAYALYFFGYSTWRGKLLYLEDIYVKQEYRGMSFAIFVIGYVAYITE